MTRFSLALSILVLICAGAEAQSLTKPRTAAVDSTPAAQAILALRKLDQDVIVYRSLGEFEENGKLARVSLTRFESSFEVAAGEIESFLAQVPPGKLRTEINNALFSYRDGLFWWRQVDQPRVVHVSSLTANAVSRSGSDASLRASLPYTVAIYWRQARKYLSRAENSISR